MNKIIQGNCLDKLKELEDNSIDSIITDPPYELGFMGKSWDNTGIANNKEMWAECLRVLKPGGHLLAFSGTRTYHRMAVAIEDAGFEVRDMIEWVYGSGFPKSLNIGHKIKEYDGWGTALKPAHEPICMARKPLAEKTVASNVLKYGTGGINIDESRVGTEVLENGYCAKKQGYMSDEHGASGGAFSKDGMNVAVGRFPANLIHDNSEEVRECFPETKSGKAVVGTGKGYAENASGIASTGIIASCFADQGNASRFFKSIIYNAKASKSERNKGCEELPLGEPPASARSKPAEGRENALGNPRANNHPTVKPIALMEYLIKMVTPKGGVVLDPFAGSGSTLVAAKQNGFQYVGIEMTEEYIPIIEARLNSVDNKLF